VDDLEEGHEVAQLFLNFEWSVVWIAPRRRKYQRNQPN